MMTKTSWSVCRYILTKYFSDIRWKLILVFLSLLLFDGEWRINNFCATVNTPITPWLFPHMTSQMSLQFTFIIGFILIVCDLPLVNHETLLATIRSGNRDWAKGVIATVGFVSLLYTLFIVGLSILFIMPSVEYSGSWGKVLNTFANNVGISREYIKIFLISDRIIYGYTPIQAMLLSILLEILCFVFLGLIMLLTNVLLKKSKAGLYVALCFAFADFFVYNDIGDKAVRFSPISMTRLSILDSSHTSYYPSGQYALFVLCTGCIILSILFVLTFQKNELQVK